MSKISLKFWLIGAMLAAVTNSGCSTTNSFARTSSAPPIPPDNSAPPILDNREGSSSFKKPEPQPVTHALATEPVPEGVTVSRPKTRPAIQQAAATMFGAENQPAEREYTPPVLTIPQVTHVPTPPVAAHVVPQPVPTSVPTAMFNGSNVRATPTVSGGILGLGPNEQPLDRVLEMAKQIDAREIENKVLQARIKTLEANAASREDSLNESIREVETATTEVMKARNDLANLRKELASVKSKLSLAEKDEIETLKLIVEALEKVLAK
jgi:hypothetical protein